MNIVTDYINGIMIIMGMLPMLMDFMGNLMHWGYIEDNPMLWY
jgi:hypothetical protein